MKRLMSIILVVTLALLQSSVAMAAYGVDNTAGPLTASATLSGTALTNLSVAIKKVADNNSATEIGWSGVNYGDGWKVSDHYIEVTYQANKAGWGIQIFTDNMSTSADPKYAGDPNNNLSQQPAGLIGESNKLLTCPMAVLVNDATISSAEIATPHEVEYGTPGTANHGYYFDTGYDEVTGGDHEKVWFWLKDKSGTKWNDANNNNVVDAGEIVSSFSSTGDDYATIVNSLGTSTGWMDASGTTMQRDNDAASPIYVYLAAKFNNAKELTTYKTNTLTLELYHQ